MIEQKIEEKVLSKIGGKLEQAGITDFQLISRLSAVEGVKGLEQGHGVIVIVRSSPRSYSTPTIPTCQIDVQVSVLVRADIDYNGLKYIDVTNAIIDIFQKWQRCYADTHEYFSFPEEFRCAGFQLGTGDFGLDQTGKVWNYNHALTIFGVLDNDY